MWGNRFGNVTGIRFRNSSGILTVEHWGQFKDKFLATLKPEELGLRFEPVREQGLKAVAGPWEVYLSEPGTPEAALRTEVYWPVAT